MHCLFTICMMLILCCTTDADVLRFKSRNEMTADISNSKLKFANYFGSHMVLQKAPQRAAVWGHSGHDDITKTVTLEVVSASGASTKYHTSVIKGPLKFDSVWKVQLKPVAAGGPYNITATLGEQTVRLTDIMFGDVWLCSGQSNMHFTVTSMFNATAEIKLADQYPNVRLFTLALQESTHPKYDIGAVEQPWTRANSEQVGHGNWTYFSAVCWLYGRHLYDTLQYPIGLLATYWDGTPVQAWSSPDALAQCKHSTDGTQHITAIRAEEMLRGPYDDPSHLWNAMIHPFLNMTIYGAIWYQGEANSGNTNYDCMFSAMIDDWRLKFYEATGWQTNRFFPFGFVQLAPNSNTSAIGGYPTIRWQQTNRVGYVPNFRMKNVFMAVTLDLPDFKSPWNPAHPRDKSTVGQRLACSGLAVAYDKEVNFQGPYPVRFSVDPNKSTLDVTYQFSARTQAPIDIRASVGFEVCCSKVKTTVCDPNVMTNWSPAPVVSHVDLTVTLSTRACNDLIVVGLRYLWRESPCAYKKCPVYRDDLPGPPFVVLFGGNKNVKD